MLAQASRRRPPAAAGLVRVAHVADTLDLGGLEKLLVEFARHADRARFDLRFVTLRARGDLAGEVEALGWPLRSLDLPPGLRPRAVVALARLFRRERVGVVHTHSEGPLVYGAPAARLAGVARVIHTRHHGPDLGSTPRRLRAMALASRCVDRVVCVAADGARCAAAEGVSAGKITTVWNGTDLDRFAYAGPAPGGPAVIVARVIPEKDHPTLLRAAALAVRDEPGFRLTIAGDGPCLDDVRSLARALGLGDRVRFLGRVADVPALLQGAGMLVLSSWLEGISLTLLEAMARGLPVVATRVGGNPEVVADGETGFLVPPRSPAEMAAAMLALWRDPERARLMGLAGRARAERHFDIRRTVARYEALYTEA